MGGGGREADAEIKEDTEEGSGATVRAEAAAVAGPAPAITVPAARRQPEWQQLWGGPASLPRRPHRGSGWGVPIAPIFWASTFLSFLHSRLLSVSWPAAPSLALGTGEAGFLSPRCTGRAPGFVLVGGPCGFSSDFGEPGRPGPRPQRSPRWLLQP